MNQPIVPLTITGTDTAKSRDANRPAVVPPITLTSANTTTAVSEPNTAGTSIVKSYRGIPPPKAAYV